jgi:nicotinate-nucleotide adenylyltransferase
LICAQEARWQLELDSVVLVPVGDAPHKDLEQDPGAETRYELCRLAVEGDPSLSVSRMEIDRDAPSYTVDTLNAMRQEAPAQELFFIMGADQALALGEWREPEAVLRLATVAVAERDGTRREDVSAALARIEGGASVRFFSMPQIDVSSSMVRERVVAGRPIRYLVPEAVRDQIERAALYRRSAA